MFEQFTIEEVNLMCIFNTENRVRLITELQEAISGFTEPEMTEIAWSVLHKLEMITDADFAALEFYPEYEDYDDEEV